jgi:hypothetical protein
MILILLLSRGIKLHIDDDLRPQAVFIQEVASQR